ncbi:heterokaryon incompatibility protein-domain-containing protein [Xylaria castorea]|nr:heterokaryon incompatibility protein-domain-containing protein [Xylaria castorea]
METLYTSLTSPNHIRLLKLHRNTAGKVDADLHIVDLETCPEYTCLSYTWGSPRWEDEGKDWTSQNQSVLIKGHNLAIGRNLRNALDHLHGVLEGRHIWIDAICINQSDTPERNAQVALMKLIYEQASDVIVWLGEAMPAWEQAIKNMDRFALTLEGYWEVWPQVMEALNGAFADCELTDEEHVQIIHFLTGNRWFSRMWTTQEQILAKEIRFLCGDISISLETIWKGGMIAVLSGATSAWADLDVRREEWNKDFCNTVSIRYRYREEPESIGANAHSYRNRQTTDPKDKVYGVLGISRTTDKWIEEPLVVDYGLSVQDIYIQAAMYGLVAWKGLEALCHVGDRTQNQIPDLPSWVPDFTQALPWKAFQKTGEDMKFKAASCLQTELYLNSVKKGVVVFKAAPIDSIVSTCDAYWKGREKMGMSEFMKLLFRPAAPTTPYDEDVASIILRLIVADGFKNEGIDPRKNLTELVEQWLFSGLFCCDEAHHGEFDLAIAFWRDPKAQIASIAEALDIRCGVLEELLEPISRGAKLCKTIEDIELGFKGRSRRDDVLARYMQTKRHELDMQWEYTGMNRRFFRTTRGYVGVGPRTIEGGDRVLLLHGAHVPYIFRHLPKDDETVFDFGIDTHA